MNADPTPPTEPVTVIIRRRVKLGREAEYEAWLQRLQAEARVLPGYLGVTTQRPANNGPREYVSAVRFDSLQSLQAFEVSEMRARHLAEVAPLVEGDAVWERLTGLEFWFSAPPGTVVPQPLRPRMALVMIVVVFTLVLLIGSAVNTAFAALPFETPYPLRRLARWIYPSKTST